LVKDVPVPNRIGRIWLPEQSAAEFRISQAEIVARGSEVQDDRLQPGLRIIVRRFRKTELEDDLVAILESDVLAIVN
jgi:co-chaperonin GroES (HSP10)